MQRAIISFILLTVIFLFLGFDLQSFPQNKKKEISKTTPTSSPKNVAGVSIIPSQVTIPQDGSFIVTKVLDGDTIEVHDGQKVRYIGVNTPENGQPYYKQAVEKNKNLVLGKQVKLQYDVQQKDQYGRTLAYVYIDTVFVNYELIKNGVGISETIQPNSSQQDLFVKAQKEARESCVGIWENLCLPTTDKCITITGINNPKGNETKDLNNEWIQLKNVCSSSVALTKWLLKDNSASSSYEFQTATIGSNQTLTLHSGCGIDTSSDIYWDCPAQKQSVWNNDGDHAYLFNEKRELVADYGY